MKAPFSYYGGKARMARRIVEMFPPHTVYVEPFCGSAAVMFAKPLPPVTNKSHYREAINDQNQNVVSIFRAMREHPEEFQRRVKLMPYSQDEHKRAWEIFNGREEENNPVERAALMWLIHSGSFGGDVHGTQTISKTTENNAITWNNRRTLIPEFCARLSQVYMRSGDALDMIKEWDSPQTLHYVDPPYVNTAQGHYGGYGEADLCALLLALDNAQGAFILSGYSNEITEGFASACGWGRRAWQSSACAGRGGVTGKARARVEVVWYRPRKCDPTGYAVKELAAVEATNTFTGTLQP